MYLILYGEVFLGIMFDYLRRKIVYSFKLSFLHPKVKRPSAMVYSNSENSENRYKEVISPMSGYQGQSKGARCTVKIRY